jgi:hypothetical protein
MSSRIVRTAVDVGALLVLAVLLAAVFLPVGW